MSKRPSTAPRLAALLAASALVGLCATPASAATGGGVDVVNTETIQVYTDATGHVQNKRVYEQLALTGNGTVDLANPIETDGLRNLDHFGGFDVKDGEQITSTRVDGEKHIRSVSNFDGDLPLSVSVTYFLDGKQVQPGDVVGEDGMLQVHYLVRNVTAVPQELTFPDGLGGTLTRTVQVPIPMVGTLSTTAPENFTEVASDEANMAGDGHGGTKLSFTMTLFPPLGSDSAEFGYTARITDGVVPRAEIAALPVDPLASPIFKTAASSYQSGADSGGKLANGASLIDENLLRLRDGAGKLLAGLIKLHDGSERLDAGLSDKAAPGSEKLADGAGRLSDGLGQLDSGVGRLSDGADQLADGQRKLAAGLTTLYRGVDGLPASVRKALQQNRDYLKLLGSLTSIAEGVGHRTDQLAPGKAPTLLAGINAVQNGMRYPSPPDAIDCKNAALGLTPTKCGALDALDTIKSLVLQDPDGVDHDGLAIRQVNALDQPLQDLWDADPTCVALAPQLTPTMALPAAGSACNKLATVYVALFKPAPTGFPLGGGVASKFTGVAKSLDDIVAAVTSQLLAPGAGLDQLRAGLSNPNAGDCAAALNTSTTSDDCGIREGSIYLRDVGIPLLVDGITANVRTQLVAGIGVPTPGCDPTKTLRCGAAALADGGRRLTTGVDQLVDGVTLLNDGGSRLADGSQQLADGLGEAADGSGRIADGLSLAAGGAPRLVDGAQRLSDEGTKKLVEAGKDTAAQYGEMYATLSAGAERARTEQMAYGAPEGASGLTAYSFIIQGDDGEDGRNLARGLGGLALLVAGSGVFALRRRLI